MERQEWHQIDALFEAALDRRGVERTALLRAAAPATRRAVERLLEADSSSGDFLGQDAAATLLRAVDAAGDGPAADGDPFPATLGPYRILGPLGGGGMGQVLLAARADDSFQRKVAIKRIRADLLGIRREQAYARFQVERQVLAQLEHPRIARLYDADFDSAGNPYLVLEYVEGGEPIDSYCDARNLDLAARLRLFAEVCRVVAFAHRHLVVHRDLKPGNILVRPDGSPILLDFGIAKWLDDGAGAALPALTDTGARPMTPGYASPEQVLGQPIGTASDVYSLGVLLYELLVGRSPYAGHFAWAHQLEEAICLQEPLRPSLALAAASDAEAIAGRRGLPATRLARKLRGDLDTLVGKALQKAPADRYVSADALADDIGRYLEGLPLAARRPSRRERLAKFARRHWLGVGLAAAALLAIGIGIAVLVAQAREVRAQRDKARQALAFLVDVFGAADPAHPAATAAQAEPLARDVLDLAARRIESELVGQRDVQATLMNAMGQVYYSLGLHEEAQSLLEQAVAGRRELVAAGADSRILLEPLWHNAAVLIARHRYDDAVPLLEEAGRIAGEQQRTSGSRATALFYQAELARRRGHHAEAVDLYRRCLALRRQQLPPDHPDLMAALEGLSASLDFVGRASDSLPLYRELLASRRRTYGDDHPDVARALMRIAQVETLVDRHQAAGEALVEALAIRRRIYGPRHRWVAETLVDVAAWQRHQGQVEESVASSREAIAIFEELKLDDVETSLGWTSLAHALIHQQRYAEATGLYRRSLVARTAALPAEHNLLTNAHLSYGIGLRLVGELERAERHLVYAYDRLIAVNKGSGRAKVALGHLALLYEARGRAAEAAAARAMEQDHTRRRPLGLAGAPAPLVD